MFVVITLVVVLARDISELGKIPLRGMRTLRAVAFVQQEKTPRATREGRNGNLPLGYVFVLITLVVVLARDISELGKIPLRGMRTLRVRENPSRNKQKQTVINTGKCETGICRSGMCLW